MTHPAGECEHCSSSFGTLADGSDVVVKVQRPGIRATIEADLHILYWLARKVEETVPEAEAFDPVAIVREFERAISKELDFSFELKNLIRFSKNFTEWDQIYIPIPHEELSSSVLVMEQLHGTKITGDRSRLRYGKCCPRLRWHALQMVFEDGFFMATSIQAISGSWRWASWLDRFRSGRSYEPQTKMRWLTYS